MDEVGLASGVNNAVARSASLLAVAVLPPLAGITGDKYRIASVMSSGYRVAAWICVVILLLGAVVVAFTVSGSPREVSDSSNGAKEGDDVPPDRRSDPAADPRLGG
jgi:MFS family permease